MAEIFLVIFVLLSLFLAGALYLSFQDRDDLEVELTAANTHIDLLDRKIATLDATNQKMREELRIHRYDPATGDTEMRPLSDFVDEIEVDGEEVEPNPQHFRPLYDSQGALFNDSLEEGKVIEGSFFLSESPIPMSSVDISDEGVIEEEEALGYESGQHSGLESVQDGEETTSRVLRSGTVPGV